MRVLIVYESKYGNTKKVAETIGEGIIEEGNEPDVTHVKEVEEETVKDYDIILIGSPTYVGSHAKSIKKFIKSLVNLPLEGKSFAVFDTHMGGKGGGFLRNAVKKMEEQIIKTIPSLKKVTSGLAVEVKGFKGPIADGELPNCKNFGRKICSKTLKIAPKE